MSARLDHHVALRVSDLDAAIRFWTEGVGGVQATPKRTASGGYFDLLFAPGCEVILCYILFEAGALELFQFTTPGEPVKPARQTEDAVMHFGVTVPDAEAALLRIEEHGGSAVAPVAHILGEPGNPRFVYCRTPDGHVFELLEVDNRGVVALLTG